VHFIQKVWKRGKLSKKIVFGKLFDSMRQDPVLEFESQNERLFVATRESQTVFLFETCDKSFNPKLHLVEECFVLHWLEERDLDPTPVLQYLKVEEFKGNNNRARQIFNGHILPLQL
jgi:hypothetical protein